MICIKIIHHCHGIPFDIIFVQQLNAVHDFDERRQVLSIMTIGVVKTLRPVD